MTTLPAAGYISNNARTEGEIKQAWEDVVAVQKQQPGGATAATSELTISSGAVTPTTGIHTIDTEADAATDDLTTINQTNLPDGSLLLISSANDGRVPTVKHNSGGTGKIVLNSAADLELSSTNMWLLLKRNGTQWNEVDRNRDAVLATANTFSATQNFTGALQKNGVSLLSWARGHIAGLTLSNNGTDATNDIDIAAGAATAGDQSALLVLSSGLTKRLDAAWAVGTNQGGLDTGSIANDVYHMWLIRRPDTGVVDVLFSASVSSPTMPANYTQKRRIGSVIRASSALLGFAQDGDRFVLKAPVVDVSTGSPGTSANLATLTVPDGLKVIAIVRGYLFNAAATAVLVTAPDQTDVAADTNTQHDLTTSSNTELQVSEMQRLTNTSGQIRYRSSVGTITLIQLKTLGWIDRRGQDAAA